MIKETAKTGVGDKIRGWIFYDGACPVCAQGRHRLGRLMESRGFAWVPLRTPGTAQRLDVPETELMMEMKLQLADGRVLGGVRAWAILFRAVWWLWPLGMLLLLPGVQKIAQRIYSGCARNRYRIPIPGVAPKTGLSHTHRHAAFFELP